MVSECDRLKSLNLGCGKRKLKGNWINVDKYKNENVDIVHNLNVFPYPFKDNSINHIYMYHVLEHLENPYDVLMECYRILKPDGIIEIYVPHKNHLSAYDIAHRNYFSERSMCHFITKGESSLQANRFFEIIKVKVKRMIPTPFGYLKGFNLYKNAVGIGCKIEIFWLMKKVKA